MSGDVTPGTSPVVLAAAKEMLGIKMPLLESKQEYQQMSFFF